MAAHADKVIYQFQMQAAFLINLTLLDGYLLFGRQMQQFHSYKYFTAQEKRLHRTTNFKRQFGLNLKLQYLKEPPQKKVTVSNLLPSYKSML